MIQLETDLTLVNLHAADKQFVEACMLHGADNEVQKHACCMTAHTLLLCQTHIFVDMQMPGIRGNKSMPLVAMTARMQMPTIGLGRASS